MLPSGRGGEIAQSLASLSVKRAVRVCARLNPLLSLCSHQCCWNIYSENYIWNSYAWPPTQFRLTDPHIMGMISIISPQNIFSGYYFSKDGTSWLILKVSWIRSTLCGCLSTWDQCERSQAELISQCSTATRSCSTALTSQNWCEMTNLLLSKVV